MKKITILKDGTAPQIDVNLETTSDGIKKNTETALKAQSEQTSADASMSNPTKSLESKLKERDTKASVGSPKNKPPKKRNANEAAISENVYNGEEMVLVLLTFQDYEPIVAAHTPANLTESNVACRAILDEV